MLTEDKVTELFFMADEFCKFFDWMMARYTLRNTGKRPYHRESTLSKAEIMLIFFGIHTANVVIRYFLGIERKNVSTPVNACLDYKEPEKNGSSSIAEEEPKRLTPFSGKDNMLYTMNYFMLKV